MTGPGGCLYYEIPGLAGARIGQGLDLGLGHAVRMLGRGHRRRRRRPHRGLVLRTPEAAVTNADRVLAALHDVYARDGRATIRTIARAAGLSLRPTHTHLRALRAAGLVAFADRAGGTLRPVPTPSRVPRTAEERWPNLPRLWDAARAADAAVNGERTS